MSKRVRRTFDSCWTCRRRRVACDARYPSCTQCKKRSLTCEGYEVRLAWVDSQDGTYERHSRRFLDPISTWADQLAYTNDELDHLVDETESDTQCGCELHLSTCNPFRILESPNVSNIDYGMEDFVEDESFDEVVVPKITTMSLARPAQEAQLLHHYVNEVAALMMPIDSDANPWRSVYPAVAIKNATHASQCLYDALLSQAAFHLSVLHADSDLLARKFLVTGTKHYCSAISSLRSSLVHHMDDFSAYTASLHTLAQVEGCYAPDLHQWRAHFSGISGLLAPFLQEQPWTKSSDAWVLTQSLALSYEIAHTGTLGPATLSDVTDTLLGSVSQTKQFGYTIGASADVIKSISKIRRLAVVKSTGDDANTVDVEAGRILGEMRRSTPDEIPHDDCSEYLSQLHQRIFRNAAAIYLYRTVYNVVPIVLQDRVAESLQDTIEFLRLGGGSISIWPVFIVAVEACTERDMASTRIWLEYSCRLGINNRLLARRIIEEVWSQREKKAQALGVHRGTVSIDWRQVQTELNIDILLL